jgi:hypothetical protein
MMKSLETSKRNSVTPQSNNIYIILSGQVNHLQRSIIKMKQEEKTGPSGK